MVAPIDATASFKAGDETFTLAMNWRTIALAEDMRSDAVTAFGQGKPTVSGLAALLWGFAQPAHPKLSIDQCLALAFQHGEAVGKALGEVFGKASPKAKPAKAGAPDPPNAPAKS